MGCPVSSPAAQLERRLPALEPSDNWDLVPYGWTLPSISVVSLRIGCVNAAIST